MMLVPFLMGTSLLFGGKDTYLVTKQSKPLEVGSFHTNWKAELTVDYGSGLEYGLSADEQNLYVLVKVSDQQQAMMVARDGIMFTVKTKGRKGMQWGMKFPFASEVARLLMSKNQPKNNPDNNNGENKGMPKPNTRDISVFNNHFLTGMSMMEVYSADTPDAPYIVNNLPEKGPQAILSMDTSGVLYYESKIPFTEILAHPEDFTEDTGDTFSFEFQVEPKRPQAPGRDGQGGEMGPPPGGGRGGNGGGMGSGGGMGPGGGQGMGGGRPDGNPQGQSQKAIKINVKKAALPNN